MCAALQTFARGSLQTAR